MYNKNCVDATGRKYNYKWEKEFKWLTINEGNAFCKRCGCFFRTFKKHNLQVHEKTKLHRKSINKKVTKSKVKKKPWESAITPDVVKECEIKLCASVACHSSMRGVNHLSEIIKLYGYSEANNLKLHRTKCGLIIKNVISVAILEEIMEDLKESKYSLLIESLNLSSANYLCICINYFSGKCNILKCEFLGLIPITSLTDAYIYNAISIFLQNYNLNLKNCIAFSSDGMNCQEINNVFVALFSQASSNATSIKCFSHDFELCYDKALKKIPPNIEFLLSEITRWFYYNSPQKEYINLFSVMSSGFIEPMRSLTPSNSRWLLMGQCIASIVSHWDELKTYFNTISNKESNYYSIIILEMLNNVKNYVYLVFLLPIVKEFENINLSLQEINPDIMKINNDLDQLHKGLLRKIFKRSDRRTKSVSINNFKLGVKLERELIRAELTELDQSEIIEKYFDFLVEANHQLENHLNNTVFDILNIKAFDPKEILKKNSTFQELSASLSKILSADINVSDLETQYSKILNIDWEEESLDREISSDIIKFWVSVKNYESPSGEKLFEKLADAVLSAFTIPFNKPIIRYILSSSDVKTKLRNRTSAQTLEAILRIRSFLHMQKKCCKDFIVTPRMKSLCNQNMYHKRDSDDMAVECNLPPDFHNNTYETCFTVPSTSTDRRVITHTVYSDNLSMPLISYSTNEDSLEKEDLKVIYAYL